MKISEERKADIYDAISEPITERRIHLKKHGTSSTETLDMDLFNLQNEIWRGIHKVLNIEGPA